MDQVLHISYKLKVEYTLHIDIYTTQRLSLIQPEDRLGLGWSFFMLSWAWIRKYQPKFNLGWAYGKV